MPRPVSERYILDLDLDPVSPFSRIGLNPDIEAEEFMFGIMGNCPTCLTFRFKDDGEALHPELDRVFVKELVKKVELLRRDWVVTAEEVRAEARRRAENILENANLLHRIILRHEETIRKRWLKRNRDKRKKLLLTAWPKMSASHRPDFDAFIRQNNQPSDVKMIDEKEAFRWPHINLEDLLNPKLLLIFLNARGRYPPYAFTGADFDSVRFAVATSRFPHPFLERYMMMFFGRNTPEMYGELMPLAEDEDDPFGWNIAIHGALPPGHGLIALEIQERIYGFLVKCCKLLLHDLDPKTWSMETTGPVPDEPPPLSTSESGLNLLAPVAAESPYRLPALIDLERLQSIVAAKRADAEDHIWSLREDPGYFSETVLDRKEHRPEIITDLTGNRHPSLDKTEFWDRVLRVVVGDAYLVLVVWSEIELQINLVDSLMKDLDEQIQPSNYLPSEVEEAFHRLIYYLEQATICLVDTLVMGLPASPPIRSYFYRGRQSDEMKVETRYHDSLVADKTRSRLMWIFFSMCDNPKFQLVGPHVLLDELERMMQATPSVRGLLSPWVMSTVSDLSVLAECRHQISLFRPWSATFELGMMRDRNKIKGFHETFVREWVSFYHVFDDVPLSDLGIPKNKRFSYPVDKRRTKETTDDMRRAEANLDEFWKTVDGHLIKQAGIWQHKSVRPFFDGERTLHRTPEWVEPVKEAKPAVENDPQRPLSEAYMELEHRTERTIRDQEKEAPTKVKVKTRSWTPETVPSTPRPVTPVVNPDMQPTIAVDKRAFKVFSTLFYSPDRESRPGEVLWTELLYAMTSIGFEVEKLYGSIWQFTPRTLGIKRSIQLHEPHPGGKIPFRTARRHGRRLLRAYSWHAGTFTLAE
jgi:hypothetical protein